MDVSSTWQRAARGGWLANIAAGADLTGPQLCALHAALWRASRAAPELIAIRRARRAALTRLARPGRQAVR